MGIFKEWGDNIDNSYKKIYEKRNSILNLLPKQTAFLIKIIVLLTVLVCIGSLIWGTKELIQGDYPIYKEVADGAVCNDGWRSHSQGPGTCSWHGGVDHYVYKDVKTGTHYANATPFYNTGIISTLFLLIPSLFFSSYRWTAIGYTIGFFYWTGFIVKIFLGLFFIVALPFYLIYYSFILPVSKKFGKRK